MKYCVFAGCVIVLVALMACELKNNKATDHLNRLIQEDWEYKMKTQPLHATYVGDHRYDDRMPDRSPQAIAEDLKMDSLMLDQLLKIDRSGLSKTDQVNYDLFKLRNEMAMAEGQYKTYLMPLTSRSGFHVSFPQLPDALPFMKLADYKNYTARLEAFGKYVDDHIALMKQGIAEGYIVPEIVLRDIEKVIQSQLVDAPEKSLLFKPVEKFPKTIAGADREQVMDGIRSAVRTQVIPGYERLLAFMQSAYIPAARATIAASDLPAGKEFYRHRIRYYTSLDLSPEEVHDTGIKEVQRIRTEMQQIIGEIGFGGDFQDFIRFLRTDKRFYVDSPEQLMKEVALVLKKMDGQLPELFNTLPRMPYGIKQVPDFIAPRSTTAYYDGPSGDGTRAGFYYVNTFDLHSRPLYEIEALSLHEAVPGHHLQIARQQELENLPAFRRFSGSTAFVEGWALYAERLGLETGFYQDPYSNFGRLTYEMWRACRLVVDTGIHYLGWSRQQAIDFMAENSALTLHNITTEVDRYISWPGQALAYKIGELKIRELRRKAEEVLSERFDIRAFHDVVLENGAVPLTVLENYVTDWMEQQSGN